MKERGIRCGWIPMLILGVGLMVAGLFRGEVEVLFQKAIHVCLECVGIG